MFPTAVGDTLYFVLRDGPDTATQLWRTDGTVAGTLRVNNVENPLQLRTDGNDLYFVAENEEVGTEVFIISDPAEDPIALEVSDGTGRGNRGILSAQQGEVVVWSDSPAGLWLIKEGAAEAVLLNSQVSGSNDGAFQFFNGPRIVPLWKRSSEKSKGSKNQRGQA